MRIAPYLQKDTSHIIHSCAKSITSTLVGIAIDKGFIKDVHQGLLNFFPEIAPGKRFEYCNGATYLLSAIIQKKYWNTKP